MISAIDSMFESFPEFYEDRIRAIAQYIQFCVRLTIFWSISEAHIFFEDMKRVFLESGILCIRDMQFYGCSWACWYRILNSGECPFRVPPCKKTRKKNHHNISPVRDVSPPKNGLLHEEKIGLHGMSIYKKSCVQNETQEYERIFLESKIDDLLDKTQRSDQDHGCNECVDDNALSFFCSLFFSSRSDVVIRTENQEKYSNRSSEEYSDTKEGSSSFSDILYDTSIGSCDPTRPDLYESEENQPKNTIEKTISSFFLFLIITS